MSAAFALACMVVSAVPAPPAYDGMNPTSTELQATQEWLARAFDEDAPAAAVKPRIEVIANNDPVHVNRRLDGPLNIAGEPCAFGFFVHAISELRVVLPGPATRLTTRVGVHSNPQTAGGKGSVEFSVEANGESLFTSGVFHEGMPAVACDVNLAGANEITLKVGDAGDGISSDQGVWADPTVTLANGETLRLDMLELSTAGTFLDGDYPFSFKYGGASSRDLLPTWKLERGEVQPAGEGATRRDLTWSAPDSGLTVRCELTRFEAFPAMEWVLWFENTGAVDTPLLTDIRSLELSCQNPAANVPAKLHHNRGTAIKANDYEPLVTSLAPGQKEYFKPSHGRPCGEAWPYFNLAWPETGGAIIAVGWPGVWYAGFERDAAGAIHITAGQETTHFVLRPGEKARSPRMVMMFWQGSDWNRAQNIWRKWMLAYNVPKTNGAVPQPIHAACSSHQYAEMINANEENQKMFVDRYLERGMKLDYWWMDAGWYPCEGQWPVTGTWEVDATRFPKGLRAVSDHAHEKGVEIIVWFEPERVHDGTWLADEHPEWLLRTGPGQALLNLGNPEALSWLIEHVDGLLNSQGIDFYRQDFNMDPLPNWRVGDTEDRQGLTENFHLQGYLAYWDELLRRHPGMLIDTCASGGHRLDLETLRRSIPLLRSDYILEPLGQQGHTYGLAPWMPIFGTGVNSFDPYVFRSQMCPTINTCLDMRPDDNEEFVGVAKLVAQWRSIGKYYYGDFHPISPYCVDGSGLMAWQYDRPDLGEGMIQVFRQENCIYRAADIRLKNLDPNAVYTFRDMDSGAENTLSGKDLMQGGLPVEVPKTNTAMIITYAKKD